MQRILLIAAAAVLMAGCVSGQSLSYDYKPEAVAAKNTGKVDVVVTDERPYVKTGEKTPDYVGHYRAGLGNTWDVTTKGKKPLAEIVATDLQAEMTALGFTPGSGGKKLDVMIREWNMDTYMNGKFWYAVDVRVLGQDGRTVLAEKNLKAEKAIEGSIWTGAKSAVETAMPKLYADVVHAIGRNDPDIMAALRQ